MNNPPFGMRRKSRFPADCRGITALAIRHVWETMRGDILPIPDDLPERLPPGLFSFAAAKGSLGAVMTALDHWGLSDAADQAERNKSRVALARTAMAAAAMRRELAGLFEACEKQKIDVLLLKGHDLITTCYHDDTIRPVTDADLLVRRSDYPALSETLSAAGYCNSGNYSGTWSRGGLIIDIHFEFTSDIRNPMSVHLPRIGSEELFASALWREIDGVAYRSPDPRHSLIITALHALTHSYLMDFWFMDAGALLIANDRPSFVREIIEIADKRRLSDVLGYHLWAIRDIFGFPGGLPISNDYRPPWPVRRLITAAAARTDYLYFGDVLLGLTIDSHKKKLYYFKEMAFPNREIVARELGIDPNGRIRVFFARLFHLISSGFRSLTKGPR